MTCTDKVSAPEQLYVDLRGYDLEHPMAPAEALAALLRALGLAGDDVPSEVTERAGRYRSMLAGRRILILLDNARSVDQVRPLLPGTVGCFVLVTSRDSLAGLVARHGAQRIDLTRLPNDDAVELLRTLIGERVEAESSALGALAERCARLPLALRVAAELAVAQPGRSLTDLVADLDDEHRRLELLDAGADERTAVEAVLSWSYRHLPADVARLFRRLGLHPGRDLDLFAVAALAGTAVHRARSLVDTLLRSNLVEQTTHGRFQMHDLLRAYAGRTAMREDTDLDRRTALTSLFDHYVRTARRATHKLLPLGQHRTVYDGATATGPPLADAVAARAWLDRERLNLLAAATFAARRGWPTHASRLAAVLWDYFSTGGHLADALPWAERRAYALDALDAVDPHVGRIAGLCAGRGEANERLHRELLATEISFYADADAFLASGGPDQLMALAEALNTTGDRACGARAWTLLSQAAWQHGDRLGALAHLRRAIDLFDELPDVPEKADVYAELGRLHMLNFEHDPAVAAAAVATDIGRRLGLIEIEANARITGGVARYYAGDRGGLAELRAVTAICRQQQLQALRRAIRNLQVVLREEGDHDGAAALLDEIQVGQPGELATEYAYDTGRAHVDGEWDKMLGAAAANLAATGSEWDLQIRGLCAEVRIMRGEDLTCVEPDEVAAVLAAGRRSGFYRLEWTALAHIALCRALQSRHDEATTLLSELIASWKPVGVIVSGEWIDAASHAAAIAGRPASTALREMLAGAPHRTPWVEAAARTVAGGVAAADGDHARAADLHLAAAELYAEMRHVTDRMLSLAAATRSLGSLPDSERAEAARATLTEFATRNKAPGLLKVARLDVGQRALSP
jgi:tetratricopeptide (TPR) repeat protein